MKALTIPLLLYAVLVAPWDLPWYALVTLGANENRLLILGWQCLFADRTPCLALEMKSKRSVKFAIFEHINRQGKEYWGKYDVIWGAHQCIFQRSNWWALCASCRLDGPWARIDGLKWLIMLLHVVALWQYYDFYTSLEVSTGNDCLSSIELLSLNFPWCDFFWFCCKVIL